MRKAHQRGTEDTEKTRRQEIRKSITTLPSKLSPLIAPQNMPRNVWEIANRKPDIKGKTEKDPGPGGWMRLMLGSHISSS